MGGVDVQFHKYFTSALYENEWSASHPDTLPPGEERLVPIR
jgi:hypothetical protein